MNKNLEILPNKKLNICIFIIFIIFFGFVLLQKKEILIIKRKNLILIDSIKIIKKKKEILQLEFKNHLSQCSFISRNSIREWKGVNVVLYKDFQLDRYER